MPPKGRKTRQNSGDFGASAKLPEAGALPTTKYVVASINFKRVRGTALTSVKEAMTEGLLPSTILPPSIHPSTSQPSHRRLGGGEQGSGGLDGGRKTG